MVKAGDLVAEKYRVERLLGEGGMGYVFAAMHEQLGLRVAVKVLSPQLCQSQEAVERFSREARASVRIQSEHVARVLDVGQLEGGAPFMVMEFLSGNDLSHEVKNRGPLPVQEAIGYVLQACEAVAEAHSLGLIHRDLKPANLFLTTRPDGTALIKVLDFGIAKAIVPEHSALEAAPSLTATHSLLGSPAYMSPEQVRTPKSVDARTDIWALGSILYEFLVGVQPFHGDSPLAMLAAVASDPTQSICAQRPEVSPDLDAIVARCLEKQPKNRYASVAELAQALGPHAPPSSLPSISRISGILRVSLAPVADPATSTLRSKLVLGKTEPAVTPRAEPGDSTRPHKQTHTDWGRSQAEAPKSHRRVLIAVGFGAVAVAAVAFARSRDVSPKPVESSVLAGPAPSPQPPVTSKLEPAKAEPPAVSTGAPVVAPLPSGKPAILVGGTASADPPSPPAASASAPRTPTGAKVRQVPTAAARPTRLPESRPAPSAKASGRPSEEEDPLDSRR